MKNLKCMILDNDSVTSDLLGEYIKSMTWLSLEEQFNNPVTALNYLRNNDIDLVFLEIDLPIMDGIEFINSLVTKPLIIITTKNNNFAVKSYENDVVDYLIKPISISRFLRALNKTNSKNIAEGIAEEKIIIKSGHQYHFISISDVTYLQKDKNYIEINLKNSSKILMRENINNVFKTFDKKYFIRTHKSIVVNKLNISTIEAHQITLTNKEILPIGSFYRENLMNLYPEINGLD